MREPMANPFRRGSPPASTRPPGLMPREWRRFYVLAALLLVMIGLMLPLWRSLTRSGPATEGPGPGTVDYTIRGFPLPARPTVERPPDASAKPPPARPPARQGEASLKELAAPFRDGAEEPVKESPEFIHLLDFVANALTAETVSKRVDPKATADQAYLQPSRFRGEVIRCYGRLIQTYIERIDASTPGNVGHVTLGILQEYLTNRTVYFYIPELPRDPDTGKAIPFTKVREKDHEFLADWVEVEGVFLRQYDYPSLHVDDEGRAVRAHAAVLFAKNLRVRPGPRLGALRGSSVYYVVGAVVGGVVAIALVAWFTTRRSDSGSLRLKLFRMKRERTEGGASAAPEEKSEILGNEVPGASAADPRPPSRPA